MADLNLFEQYSDAQVISEILSGKDPLYEVLIRRNNPFLYRLGRAYGFDHHATEDLMQETYIDAYYHLAQFANRSAFKTWISRIMLNHCYRKKQKHSFKNEVAVGNHPPQINNPMFHNSDHTEKKIMNKELGHVLENALGQLPEDYRMVFTLRELNGLSVAETAEAIDISETNVKVRLNRAKTMLRTEIEKMYSPADIFEFNLVYCNRIVERVLSSISVAK